MNGFAARLEVSIGLLAALLASCAVGPDFTPPAPPQTQGYTPEPLPEKTASSDVAGGEAQRFVEDMDIPAEWWTLFQSEPLDTLVRRALAANADLQAAQAALRVAQENVLAQQGAYYPAVQANLSPSRNKTATGSLSPASASGNPYYSLYTAQVSVSYAPDVFGLNRRQVEALEAQAETQRFALEATYITLTSNVVAAAIEEASLRAQIAATQEIVRIEIELRDLLRRQSQLGQIAEADVIAQEATLAQVEATLPPLRKQLALQRNLLAALTGAFPSEEPAERFELASFRLPQDLPVSLPSKLVEQRPDVRAAEEQLHAASAQIGIATANMLPNITLTAVDGTAANRIGDMFTPATGFWSIAASLMQPIFQGGTLLHRKRAAEAGFDQAAAQYRSTVIAACHNVADTLRALEYDADSLRAAVATERAAHQSLEIGRRRMALGDISYLALLNAEQTYQQALINLAVAQGNRYADTAALFQALGGGWWNASDPAISGVKGEPKQAANAH